MKKTNIALAFLLFSGTGYSQAGNLYRKQLIFGMGGGYTVPIIKYFTTDPMDGIVAFRDKYWGLNPSLQFFLRKHWGVMVDFQIDVSAVSHRQRNALDKGFENIYSEKYELIRGDYFYGYGWGTYHHPATFRFAGGPAYRFEKGRSLLCANIGIGLTSFETTGITANLLKKNTNEYHMAYLDEWSGSERPFAIVSGIIAGYKLNRRLTLALNSKAAYFKTNFSKTLKRINRYTTLEEQDAVFAFHKKSLSLSTNLSLLFSINFK